MAEQYKPSKEVQEAAALVAAQKRQQPGAYQSGWEAQLRALMERILNREDFHYNLNGDALYRQYRDQAARNGQLAMADAMGQAAAMTGGYGNSYAQAAGEQAYSRELDALSDRIPELYALALEQYRQQAEGLQQRYELLAGAEGRDYSRWQDALAAWQKEADSLWGRYADARDFDYSRYRDRVADWKWQTDYDEDLRRYEKEWAAAHPVVTAPTVTYSAPKKEEKEKKVTTGPQLVML